MSVPRWAALSAGLGLLAAAPGHGDLAQNCAGATKAAARGAAAPRTIGTYAALVIFAKFAGEAAGDDHKPPWADDLFDAAIEGSFSHFYDEMSGGRLRLSGQVLPKRYASRQPASAYVAAEPGTLGQFARFNEEILAQADLDVDLGRFDDDGPDGAPNSGDDDGYVDVVFINLLTVPREFFIGGATGYASTGLKTDFLSNDPAAGGGVVRVRSQSSGFGGTTQRGHTFRVTAATMCHEFGHVLGLPDLFDQSTVTATGELDPVQDSAGIGKWDLMSLGTLGWGVEDGPNAFSAWSRAQLGWLGPDNERLVEVSASRRGVVLDPIDRGGEVLKVRLTEDEYFLVENRQVTDSWYNRSIPAGGLLVWHVDERADNDEERHKQVDLVCADGRFADRGFPGAVPDPAAGGDNLDFWARDAAYASSHNGNQGDATDPFDGVVHRRFAFDTNPGTRGHAGDRVAVPFGFALDGITPLEDGRMRLDVLLHQPLAGNVGADTTWAGEVAVAGDVVVEPGATLTLAAGTRVTFAGADGRRAGFDSTRCELIVYGDLVVAGTPDRPVRLARQSASARTWLGVLVPGGSSPDLDEALAAGGLALDGASLGLARGRLPPGVTTWRGARAVPWDLVVPAGAELRLEAGSTVRFAPADRSWRGVASGHAELVVEGVLTARGGALSPVTLTVDSSDRNDLWYGIQLVAGGALDARGLTVTQAVAGVAGVVAAPGGLALADSRLARLLNGLRLTLYADAAVEGTSFSAISANAVRAEGFATLLLRGCTIEANGREGVFVSNAGLRAIDCRIAGNGILDAQDPRSGLAAEGGRGQTLALTHTTVDGNRRHGLELVDWQGAVEILGGAITGNRQDGLRTGGGHLTLDSATVARNLAAGARLAATSARVGATTFADNAAGGLLAEGGSLDLTASRFSGSGLVLDRVAAGSVRATAFAGAAVALRSAASAPAVAGNRFEGNGTALRVEGPPVPAPIRNNVFLDNATAIDNRTAGVLDARQNWFGTTDSAAIAALLAGPVDASGYLQGEPDLTAVTATATGVPAAFALLGNRPNPFNGVTVVAFDLPALAPVELVVYDVLGRRVRRLVPERELAAGRWEVAWDGTDDGARPVASGVYPYRLTAGRDRATGRMLLAR